MDGPSFIALPLQVTCHAVNKISDPVESRQLMMRTISRLSGQIKSSLAFIGRDARLVVLPEYFLTGFPMGESAAAWRDKACLAIDGPEYEALGRIAQDNKIYLAGNAYENDPHWPNLYFQTTFILAPSGAVCLRYRRLNSMYAPSPHDVWQEYLAAYGLDGVFPVARTEIGNLAAIASEEIIFPEVARCLAVRGAEIFVHPSSETYGAVTSQKDVAKAARAIENIAYVVSANSAGIEGLDLPAQSADGGSRVVDFRGSVLTIAGPGENMTAWASVDLGALRSYRRRPGNANYLARQRFELYADTFRTTLYPPETLRETFVDRTQFQRTQEQVIERLVELGVIQ